MPVMQQQQLPKPRVLVVDEVNRTLRLAHAFLMQEYEVTCCLTVAEALDLLGREAYHVLVASHHLQAMDVFELATRARQMQPHLHCLVVSSTTPPHDPVMNRPFIQGIKAPCHPATMLMLTERLVIKGEKAAEEFYSSGPNG